VDPRIDHRNAQCGMEARRKASFQLRRKAEKRAGILAA
jgi:hypothetical protein